MSASTLSSPPRTKQTASQAGERSTEVPRRRHPLVLVLFAAAAGMIVDRHLQLELTWLLAAGFAFLVLWLCLHRYEVVASFVLLVSTAGAASSWHQLYWSWFDRHDLAFQVSERGQPVAVEAIALGSPRRVAAERPGYLQTMIVGERSRLLVRPLRVRDGSQWRPSGGRAQLTVNGHLLAVERGDRLLIYAKATRPSPPANPGDVDYSEYHRSQRRLCLLHAGTPDAVRVLSAGGPSPLRGVQVMRQRGLEVLARQISPDRAALASAILLGQRELIDRQTTDEFLRSGTIHLLAISGLHVGILALGLLAAIRLSVAHRRLWLVAAAGLVLFYAVLVDARPPIVRASILIAVLCLARVTRRRALAFNSLAAAALLILALNPATLFHIGAQLSFLAVATLIASAGLFQSREPSDPLDRLIANSRSWPQRALRSFLSWCGRLWWASFIVWIVALPLVTYQFHVLSIVAIVINPLLWPAIAAALFSGFGVLLVGWLVPPLGSLLGSICDGSLWVIQQSVVMANALEGSFLWTAGPRGWWVIVTYAILGILVAGRVRIAWRWRIALLAAWIAIGVITSKPATRLLLPPQGDEIRCTVLSLGHGSCVVLELPNGRVLMYDCGRMGLPNLGARSVAHYLWSEGITHLDAVMISHGDADHYNMLPDLLERFSIGQVIVSPTMFRDPGPALEGLHQRIVESGVPLEVVSANDRLIMDPRVEMDLLHPTGQGVAGSENANSLVLRVRFEDQTLLLPGDLEHQGLDDFLAEEPFSCDVILAPHHGSVHSHPLVFLQWTRPHIVVISAPLRDQPTAGELEYLQSCAQVLHTGHVGAVRVVLREGESTVRAWRLDGF